MPDGAVISLCSRAGCVNPTKGKGRYCSDSCRAKASHTRNFKRITPKPYDGPKCWCGKPGRFEDNGRPKCGNHAVQRRAQKDRWRKIFKEMQSQLTIEEARECVRLAVTNKLVFQEQAA